jgi:hypothetical protein
VTSKALSTWQSARAARLDRLEAAHAAVGGSGPGRRWLTEELNHALILRMAAEFQGYARDLHEEAGRAVAAALAPDDPALQATVVLPYQLGRRLDRSNADPNALDHDFGMFGLDVWEKLERRSPTRSRRWRQRLALLNQARNGLAHADDQKVARVEAAGWPLTLRAARRWRGTLDGLATAMDRVVLDHVNSTFEPKPQGGDDDAEVSTNRRPGHRPVRTR